MSSALISPCGTYRYTLGRNLRSENRANKPCLFIILNPSTGDAEKDDPTIRRCIGFAEREGCTFLTIVNLFAFRTAFPSELIGARKAGFDVIGPENAEHVGRELRRHNVDLGHLIIAAWGACPIADLGFSIKGRVRGVMCLGKTKDGYPRHPARLANAQPLEPWP